MVCTATLWYQKVKLLCFVGESTWISKVYFMQSSDEAVWWTLENIVAWYFMFRVLVDKSSRLFY